ncbi:transcription/translation regulatory transformer protein RfaH [Pseudomonas delhiensis]|uniref:transcription/translation regulatory transformer protein RfaH n=1 Tax=Pseudomonas delhiensis TaxID=366289 RepID=UPI00315A7D53
MPDATGKRWYLVQCKPRQAPRALEHLERQGYQCVLYTHQIERLQKGKLQQLTEPLFPGYLFIQLDRVDDNWLPIRSTRGVSQIVGFGGRPTPVPDSVIVKLNSRPSTSFPALHTGDRVSIADPALQTLEAIFLETDGEGRVLLLLRFLQRNIALKAPLSLIRKI